MSSELKERAIVFVSLVVMATIGAFIQDKTTVNAPSNYARITNVKPNRYKIENNPNKGHNPDKYLYTDIDLTYHGKRYHHLAILGSEPYTPDFRNIFDTDPEYASMPYYHQKNVTLDDLLEYNSESKIPRRKYAIQYNWGLGSVKKQLKRHRVALVSNTI